MVSFWWIYGRVYGALGLGGLRVLFSPRWVVIRVWSLWSMLLLLLPLSNLCIAAAYAV